MSLNCRHPYALVVYDDLHDCPMCALEKRELKADKKAKQQDLEIAELKYQRQQLRSKLANATESCEAARSQLADRGQP